MSTSSPRYLRTPLHHQGHSQSTLSQTSDSLNQSTSLTHTSRSSTDPQALLLQRWNQFSRDLTMHRLSRKTVITLNRNLDEAEELLVWDAPERFEGRHLNYGGLGIVEDVFEHQKIGSQPPTPPRSRGFDAPEGIGRGKTVGTQGHKTEPMLGKITHLVEELRKRQEEFKHLHNIAIAKAEQGVEEIVQLEQSIEHLQANCFCRGKNTALTLSVNREQDITDDESELTYLKLQLRMLEIEAAPYLSTREHDSLAEGIRRWKLDWADVDSRFRMRRRRKYPGKTHSVSSSLSVEHQKNLPAP